MSSVFYRGAERLRIFTAEPADVGQFLRRALEKHFEEWHKPDLTSFTFHETHSRPQSVLAILRDQLKIFSGRLLDQEKASLELLFQPDREGTKLLDDLIDSSAPAVGQDDLLGYGSLSEIQARSFGAHRIAWATFKYYAKHYGRYVDHPGTHPRETILKPIADYFPQGKTVLPVGTEMWRSRVMKKRDRPQMWGGWGFAKPDDAVRALIDEDRRLTAEKLGPPPIRLSKNSRMSPAGISYTYLASDQETCRSEIRPNVGDYVWSGRFETTQPLAIVGLTSIRKARPRSLFTPDFIADEVEVRPFLQDFADEISASVAMEDSTLVLLCYKRNILW